MSTSSSRWLAGVGGMGGIAFHASLSVDVLRGLVVLTCLGALSIGLQLTPRRALGWGWVYGFVLFAPQLLWMWSIFGGFALVLWGVLGFWIGLFTNSVALLRRYVGTGWCWSGAACLLWCGMEYVRCELNWLRFTWMSTGFVLGPHPLLPWLGFYGSGLVAMVVAVAVGKVSWPWRGLLLLGSCVVFAWSPREAESVERGPLVVGVQLEFPSTEEVVRALAAARGAYPEADVFFLSEYTFRGEVPPEVVRWVDQNDTYLLVGGMATVEGERFNMAFVYGPEGELVFQQAKAQPIQFFRDGAPAREQRCWSSPWGTIGIAVCYDLSYSRCIDPLVEQGAQALLVPTMDVTSWGAMEHGQHARVAPLRAREYGVPVMRVCSSGISQVVDRWGRVCASAPFPGQGERIVGRLDMGAVGQVPPFRWLAWLMGYGFLVGLGVLWVVRLVEQWRA